MVGTTVDSLHITDFILNQPSETNFNKKFKVLEFWATWCQPCLKAVPHLNKLQAGFKNENVVFLSVTYQKPADAAKAFEKVRFETIVATDTTRKLHRDLRVQCNGTMALPRTVLIDDQNKILWYGSPNDLDEKTLRQFLKKERS